MSSFESTILITGGTTGLGLCAAQEIASQLPRSKVIIASRSDKDNAAWTLNQKLQRRVTAVTSNQVEYLPLDLSSNASIRTFAAVLRERYPPLRAFLMNAGVQFYKGKELRMTSDNIEMTFATNHAGHALLFFLLKSHLTDDARIVLTASNTHDPAMKTGLPDAKYISAELLAHPTDHEGYETNSRGLQRYSTSKLVNVMFMYALERRLKAMRAQSPTKKWTVVAMDPGLMPGTSLGRDLGPTIHWIFVHLAPHLIWLLKLVTGSQNVHRPQESGHHLARHALGLVDASPTEASGGYFEGDKRIQSSRDSYDETKQEDLWNWTVETLSQDDEEKSAFETF